MKPLIADLHCHPTLRPFNMKDSKVNIWTEINPDKIKDQAICKYSQCDFTKAAKGNVKIVFASLYPIEQGFFDLKLLGTSIITDGLIHQFLDFPITRIEQVQSELHDYFYDLQTEYKYLYKQQGKPQKITGFSEPFTFKIVSNYHEIQELFDISENYEVMKPDRPVITVILTIEGSHSLGCGTYQFKNVDANNLQHPKTKQLLKQLKSNIRKIKNWNNGNHCPFFITFSHHFWNQLCGNTISFYKTAHWFFDQYNPDNSDYNTPFTKLGKEILRELLSTSNGRRILIDTKHMTANAKINLIHFFKQENISIPIISSHSSVNQVPTINQSHVDNSSHRQADKKYKNSTIFNSWDINISDEEILWIHETGGIIGINFDERIVMGFQLNEKIKKLIADETNPDVIKKICMIPFANNFLYIATLISKTYHLYDSKIWENICIGSDFDGLINPVDAYRTSETFQDLVIMLNSYFKENRNNFDVLKNTTDSQINEIIEGFLYKNVLKFLNKHFN